MRSVFGSFGIIVCAAIGFHTAQPAAAENVNFLTQPLPSFPAMLGRDSGPGPIYVADHFESEDPRTPLVHAPQTGRLILVRHADRDSGELLLNARGKVRALALPGAIADISLDVIAISDFQRNKDTAAPLAADRGLMPVILPVDSDLANALAQLANDSDAIWIGNVGNLAEIWDAFRLSGRPPIDYGQIAVLTAEDGSWDVRWRQF